MSFLFFAAALKIQQQNAYRGNTDTSDNLPQQGSSALNEVPSWQMNGQLAEWREDMNQRHIKRWQWWPVNNFTNTHFSHLFWNIIDLIKYNEINIHIFPMPHRDVTPDSYRVWNYVIGPDFCDCIGTSLIKIQRSKWFPFLLDISQQT